MLRKVEWFDNPNYLTYSINLFQKKYFVFNRHFVDDLMDDYIDHRASELQFIKSIKDESLQHTILFIGALHFNYQILLADLEIISEGINLKSYNLSIVEYMEDVNNYNDDFLTLVSNVVDVLFDDTIIGNSEDDHSFKSVIVLDSAYRIATQDFGF